MAVAQLTDKMDPMYIIPNVQPEPSNDAHVIFFLVFPIFTTRGPTNFFLGGSSSAHTQDGPQVYHTKTRQLRLLRAARHFEAV